MTVAPFTVDRAPARLSMSFIRAAEGCMRRADAEREASYSGPDAVIGSVFHAVAASVGFLCLVRGEVTPQQDEAERIARSMMERYDQPLPKSAWDAVLRMLWWWAPRAEFRPGELFEVGVKTELDGRTLSARIDRLAIDGDTAYIRDYKTGWADPANELSIQGEVYAWHVFQRSGEIERVVYAEDHVRAGLTGGPWELTRGHAEETEDFLRGAIKRIDAAYARGGELPATPGSACSSPVRCPVASTCPVAQWARPATAIESPDDATAQFEQMLVLEAQTTEVKEMLRGWVDHAGERALQLNGQEIGYAAKPGNRFDKKALLAELTARGEDVDLDAYMKPTKPSFGRRKSVEE